MTYAVLILAWTIALPLLSGPMAMAADIPGTTVAPLAMQAFCHNRPGECRPAQDAVVEWTPQLAALITETNARVNRDIGPRADPGGAWEVNPAFGDCNDYAVSKRSRLIRLGVPPGALRLAITRTRGGLSHAILVVRTSAGDIVLDNLTGSIKTLAQSGYSIRSISTANPMRWARL
nr:transglutaminase-like cysteine peptidase [uncultured Devosia sp.]